MARLRMSKTSQENIKVATSAIIAKTEFGEYIVKVYRNDSVAYVSDRTGVILYPTLAQARRRIKNIRADLEPTTI